MLRRCAEKLLGGRRIDPESGLAAHFFTGCGAPLRRTVCACDRRLGRRPPTAGRALVTGQVAPRRDRRRSRRRRAARDGVGLVEAVLERAASRPARGAPRRRRRSPAAPPGRRRRASAHARLVPQRRQVRVVVGDVRRVGDARSKRRPPRPLPPRRLDAARSPGRAARRCAARRRARPALASVAVTSALRAALASAPARSRRCRCRGRRTRRGRSPSATLRGQRRSSQRPVDQQLGLRARHEHVGVDLESQAVELLLAEQVGERLAGERGARARPAQRADSAGVSVRSSWAIRRVRVVASRRREQQLGVERGDAAPARRRRAPSRPSVTTRRSPARRAAPRPARPAARRSPRRGRRRGSPAACTASGRCGGR